jgi:hypothetical protein
MPPCFTLRHKLLVWLQPIDLARNFGFSPKELRRIQRLVIQHQAAFLEAWHGHLGADG